MNRQQRESWTCSTSVCHCASIRGNPTVSKRLARRVGRIILRNSDGTQSFSVQSREKSAQPIGIHAEALTGRFETRFEKVVIFIVAADASQRRLPSKGVH